MIGSISQGNSFDGVLRYTLNPEKKPKILGGNCSGNTIEELSKEFKLLIAIRPQVKTPVRHISLAFAPEDGYIEDNKKLEIANKIMQLMGYEKSIYVVIDHDRNDPRHKHVHDHDHIHIISSSIDIMGKKVKDSWNYPRLEKILRTIEEREEMKTVINSKNSLRRGKNTKIELNPMYYEIESTIVALTQQKLDFKDFVKKLSWQKINIKLRLREDGSVGGISYEKNGIAVAGCKMRNTSYPKLIHRGVIIDPLNDSQNVRDLQIEKNQNQSKSLRSEKKYELSL